jgi:hypothetical protein
VSTCYTNNNKNFESDKELVKLLGWVRTIVRPLPTKDNTDVRRRNAYIWAGFEPIISMFERFKTVSSLDRAATLIGKSSSQHFDLIRPLSLRRRDHVLHLSKNEADSSLSTLHANLHVPG